MKLLDRAKSHYENLGTQSIEVPEWSDEDNNPAIIYWNPLTLAENKKLLNQSTNGNMLDPSILADLIIMKALDKDGTKLFSLEDKLVLMNKVDVQVLSRIANAMSQTPTVEDLKKK